MTSSNEDDGVAINENMLREGDCHSSFQVGVNVVDITAQELDATQYRKFDDQPVHVKGQTNLNKFFKQPATKDEEPYSGVKEEISENHLNKVQVTAETVDKTQTVMTN